MTSDDGPAASGLNPQEQDAKADAVIASMVAAGVGGAVIPVVLTLPYIAALCAGVVAIGRCYGTELTKDEAWKLVRQLILAAGFTTMAVLTSSKLIAAILASTGVGYLGGVAMDAVSSAAIAYAVGGAAKSYFKGERNNQILGRQVRDRLRHATSELRQGRGL